MNRHSLLAKIQFVSVIAWGIMLASCGPQGEQNDVILQREWTVNAEYAGDVWASSLAADHGINMDVREGSELNDPLKVVRSGEAHFGVASADRILQENEGGADLVILGAATYKSPVVFLVQPKIEFASISDLNGKVVGLQAGTNTELVFKALARAVAPRLDDVKIVESGWGTTTFETQSIDVLGAFAYDEPVSLEMKGKSFQEIKPETYGVHYVGTVYFTRRALVDDDPDLVRVFMKLLADGWHNTIQSPEEAVNILAERYSDIRGNRAKTLKSLRAGLTYFEGENGKLFYVSQARWNRMTESLIGLGVLESFDFKDNVDYRFLADL